jgi:hypothetical protein
MNRDEQDKDLNDLISDSRLLFGDVEEMDKDELMAVLDDSERPAGAVRQAMFLKLEMLVRDFRLRGEPPPQRYLDALNQLRPPSQISHNPNALVQQAKRWVMELLGPPRSGLEAKLQFSFHRKEDLTDSDERILKETEAEVCRRMKQKK